jgi:hypothetical protein
MIKHLISILFLGFFVSCHDMKKREQLHIIETLVQTVDSIHQAITTQPTDFSEILESVNSINQEIQNNFQSDTISIEFGQKLENFKSISQQLRLVQKNIPLILKSFERENSKLRQLKQDIIEGTGNRSNYRDYIYFEKKKVNQLVILSNYTNEQKNAAIYNFNQLNQEIKNYSTILRNKNLK